MKDKEITHEQYVEAITKAVIGLSKDKDGVNVMVIARAAFELSAKLLATLEDGIRGEATTIFAKNLPRLVEEFRPGAVKCGINVEEVRKQ